MKEILLAALQLSLIFIKLWMDKNTRNDAQAEAFRQELKDAFKYKGMEKVSRINALFVRVNRVYGIR